MKIKIDFKLKNFLPNRVIKYFIFSDLLFLGGWGMISPIFAIFLIERIPDVNLFTIGAVAAVYWLTRSLIQMPVAIFLDKHDGEKDDFYTLIMALTLGGFAAMAFLVTKSITAIFLVSFLHGISFGLYVPSWSAIFSRHLDSGKYAFDWSLDNTTIGLSAGISAFFGGSIAKIFGFEAVFIFASLMSFASALFLLLVPNLILPKPTLKEPFIKDHSPVNVSQ